MNEKEQNKFLTKLQPKIAEKFRLLSKEQQQAIKDSKNHKYEISSQFAAKITPEEYISKEVSSQFFNLEFLDKNFTALPYSPWINTEYNWLFIPFIWDVVNLLETQHNITTLHKTVAIWIANAVKTDSRERFLDPKAAREFAGHLYYAQLQDTDFSKASLKYVDFTSSNLQNANFKDANLIGARARGADFRNALNLTPAQLITFDSLYQVKFDLSNPIQQNQFKPEEITRLENFIIYSYREELRTIHKSKKPTGKYKYTEIVENGLIKTETAKLDDILSLIRYAGFSPLQWAVEEEKFNQTFERINKQYTQILLHLKQEAANIVTLYPKERLQNQGLKSVLQPAPRDSRTHQIAQLKSIQDCKSISAIMNILTNVQTEIKKESSIWPSDLLKKIDHLIDETRNNPVSTDQKSTNQSLNQ